MSDPASNTVRHGVPSRTAAHVATLRAVHQLLDEPLVLPDPIALPLLGASTEAALRDDPYRFNDPLSRGLRAAVVARSRFVEDELSRCMAQGVHQYVVLGAGLDTYACRHPGQAGQLQVYEVDHAGTQAWKQKLLADAGIVPPPSLSWVPMDFERDDLLQTLAGAGFRAGQAACVSWMGVTPYLTADAVWRLLRAMAGLAPGSCLCFDYRVPSDLLNPIERTIDQFIAGQAAAAGEPWQSSFDPAQLQARMLEAGFRSADSATPDGLNASYFARRKDGLRMGGGLRILCART